MVTIPSLRRCCALFVTVASLLAIPSVSFSYTIQFSLNTSPSAFVGQSATFTLQFLMELSNPPPGVVSVGENYSGAIDFGDGSTQPFTFNLFAPIPAADSEIKTFSHRYAAEGRYTSSASFNIIDTVCTTDDCFTSSRQFQTKASTVAVYSPESTNDYVELALANARRALEQAGTTNPTDIELARQGFLEAIRLREQNVDTSQSPILRDAEYMLRGYAGGLLLHSLDPSQFGTDPYGGPGDLSNDLVNACGPLCAALYNAKKMWNDFLGNGSSSNNLPASPPGGMEANTRGFLEGLKGGSPTDLTRDATYRRPEDARWRRDPT